MQPRHQLTRCSSSVIAVLPTLSLLQRWSGLGCLLLLIISIAGCGNNSGDPRGIRYSATGRVLLDQQPLPQGRIVLVCNPGECSVKAITAISEGRFEFTESNGPLEGEARVEIYPAELELEQFESARGTAPGRKVDVTPLRIPARYNVRSALTVQVSPNPEQNQYTFELTSGRR